MREFKFRERFNDGFHYWGWIDGRFVAPLTSGIESMKASEQYTGLKDKNGKEIYERDIIQNYLEMTGVVEFENGAFFAKLRPTHNKQVEYEYWNGHIITRCEVIGNIYENPELLKR